jgi:glycosyltransferase involved in cell wall biosynthesis
LAEPRILQFCHCYYGPFADVARQYAVLFKDTPYKVTTVYLTEPPDEAVAAQSDSDEVIFLGYEPRDVRGLKLDAMRQLRKIVAERDFRLVIAHRFKPIYIACWATSLPVIGVHHAFGDYERRSHRLFMRMFSKRLNLLGVSDAIRDDIRKCLPKELAERVQTFHNRIDVDAVRAGLLTRSAARERLGLPESEFVVGNVGRLHPDKDQATLLRGFARALPQLPEGALLAILGEGRLEQELKALAVTLGVAERVRFLGQVPEARKAFMAFDVFALSSDHEPFGMVMLEAMAAGIPVIATDCGGAPEIVRGFGSLFPLGDEAALSKLLIEYAGWSDEQRRDSSEQSLIKLHEDFSDASARRRFFELSMVKSTLAM